MTKEGGYKRGSSRPIKIGMLLIQEGIFSVKDSIFPTASVSSKTYLKEE